jgi:hypothetical protein
MIIWIIAGIQGAGHGYEAMSEAEKAGTAIGTGIGVFLIGAIWAIGDFILGLMVFFTRPKS